VKTRLTTRLLILFFACILQFLAKGVSAQEVRRLSLPDSNWGLDISLAGFTVVEEAISTDGRNYALNATLERRPDGRLDDFSKFTIRITPSPSHGDSKGAQDFAVTKLEQSKGAKKGRVLSGKVKIFEYKGIPISRYESTLDLADNLPIRMPQQSMEAYFEKSDVWIVINFSSSSIDNYEVKLVNAVLDSVQFVDTPANPTNSFDFYQRGRALFFQNKYAMAIESYSTALKLEQNEQTLPVTVWRRLVEELTDSYSISGNISRSIEILEYGTSKDPTYPWFHLGLAHWYASKGDLDNTIASLEKAFKSKENNKDSSGRVIPLPDPMFERRFDQFKKVDKFRKAVKAMMK
jgi:tetratricopeptide (TPR) repeat protein